MEHTDTNTFPLLYLIVEHMDKDVRVFYTLLWHSNLRSVRTLCMEKKEHSQLMTILTPELEKDV